MRNAPRPAPTPADEARLTGWLGLLPPVDPPASLSDRLVEAYERGDRGERAPAWGPLLGRAAALLLVAVVGAGLFLASRTGRSARPEGPGVVADRASTRALKVVDDPGLFRAHGEEEGGIFDLLAAGPAGP